MGVIGLLAEAWKWKIVFRQLRRASTNWIGQLPLFWCVISNRANSTNARSLMWTSLSFCSESDAKRKGAARNTKQFLVIQRIGVDTFGKTPKAGKITNVSGVSLGYVNNNILRKGQANDMNWQSISNLALREVRLMLWGWNIWTKSYPKKFCDWHESKND